MITVDLGCQKKTNREKDGNAIDRGTAFYGVLVGYEGHGRRLLVKTNSGYFDLACQRVGENLTYKVLPLSTIFWGVERNTLFTEYEEVDLLITVQKKRV